MRLSFLLLSIILILFYYAEATDDNMETMATVKDKSACALPPEVGPCRGAKTRYYYENESKACKEFFYGGCQGNDNNFETQEECQKLCMDA